MKWLFDPKNWKGKRLIFTGTFAGVAALAFFAALFYGLGLLLRALWSWTIPNLFPRLVAEGYLAHDISLWTAIATLLLLAIIGGVLGGARTSRVVNKEKPAPAVLGASAEDGLPVTAASLPRAHDLLSDREREVLELLAKGLTNAQIAAHLGVSESTIVFHCGRIFEKLGVSSRVEAAVWAKEHGVI